MSRALKPKTSNTSNTSTPLDLYSGIIADPIFTPALVEQIASVQEFTRHTERFVNQIVDGTIRDGVLQGPPGLGKSYQVGQALKRKNLKSNQDYVIVKGHMAPTDLYLTMNAFRRKGQIVVLDDCDDLLIKDVALEVLKAACDTDTRYVCWSSRQTPCVNGVPIKDFTFNGTMIICTNMSLRTGTNGRRDTAANAFLSRLGFWDMKLGGRERGYAQIFNMIVYEDYLNRNPETTLTDPQKKELLVFLLSNLDDIRYLDLRMPQMVARMMVAHPAQWQHTARHMITHGQGAI